MIHCSKNPNLSLVLLTSIEEQSRNAGIPSLIGDTVGLIKFYSGLTVTCGM